MPHLLRKIARAVSLHEPRRSLLMYAPLLLVAVAAVLIARTVGAVTGTTLSIASISGEQWSAEGITATLDLSGPTAAARISVRKFRLPRLGKEATALSIDCKSLAISADSVACESARIKGALPDLGAQTLTGRGEWHRASGALSIDLRGLHIGDGNAQLAFKLEAQRWQADFDVVRVALQPLQQIASSWKLPLPIAGATGKLTIKGKASGAADGMEATQFVSSIEGLSVDSTDGTFATDKLDASVQVAALRVGKQWNFATSVDATQGQGYLQPIFLDFAAHRLQATAQGEFVPGERLTLATFDFTHAGVAEASARGEMALGSATSLRSLELSLRNLEFPGAYASYLQPLLLDTNFRTLKTSGRVSGHVVVANAEPQRVDLQLAKMGADDGTGKVNVEGLSGEIHWSAQAAGTTDSEAERETPVSAPSMLTWQRATLLHLQFGAGQFKFSTLGRQLRLLEPARVPLFDGAVRLDSLRVRNVATPDVAFLVDAAIEPVNVRQLCRAFGWPEFGGSVGGTISKLRMRDGIVTLGTALQAQVFNGQLTLADVKLEDPFGKWPRFYSNIAFDNLDLALVTDAFSFGRITGKLSGQIAGLQLFNWTPVAFEARLATPPDDRSPHRISQRAVENIGSLGGTGAGVTAALSSGFLRFFEDFNYDQLGITCTLKNDVCLMGGVAPAKQGYYLVKGKGVPRIDVIANGTRVDWPRMLAQLTAITKSSGPVVK